MKSNKNSNLFLHPNHKSNNIIYNYLIFKYNSFYYQTSLEYTKKRKSKEN